MNLQIVRVALLCLAVGLAAPLHAAEQPDKDDWIKGRLFVRSWCSSIKASSS